MKYFIKLFIVSIVCIFNLSFVCAKSAEETYGKYCSTCHSPNMAAMFKAPVVHDQSAWQERKDLALNRAIEKNGSVKSAGAAEQKEAMLMEFLNVAKVGTAKGMPPKGTCMECTDEDLKAAIDFMSSNAK